MINDVSANENYPLPLSDRIAKDPRFERLICTHKGTYADDCIVDRVTEVCPGLI
jgi:rRNA-processing protein FCF1